MALKLHLKRFNGLKDRSVWQARATFRGVSYRSKICALGVDQNEARFDEVFEWSMGRPIDAHETLDIHLINKSKYNIAGANRNIWGAYRLVLQELLTQKHLVICDDALIDLHNHPTSIAVTLELHYVAPNDSLYQMEQSLTELEKQYAAAIRNAQASQGHSSDTDTESACEKSTLLKRIRKKSMSSTVRNIANIIKLKSKTSRYSPGVSDDEAEGCSLTVGGIMGPAGPVGGAEHYASAHSILRHMSDNTLQMWAAGGRLGPHTDDAHAITSPVFVKKTRPADLQGDALKAQDFQICVTIIEARHLAGLNMDPVVCVQVADQRKYTSVKESTNCPYYNEYFVFDFHCAEAVLFDKMVTLTALHSRNIIRSGKVIGSFKLDVATIFRQPDHQFWHKWAVLTDPDDMSGGPKGYVKCDVAVVGKGEAAKPPASQRGGNTANAEQDDDIEGNLLLPEGMPLERQHARYIVSVHEADGLPRASGGNFVASVKKVLVQDNQQQLINTYVQVSFAGLTGKTSVKKSCCSPAWNEQVVFTEMFPPLCQRIKLQLRDNGPVKDAVIATHFIDISKISNDGDKGFLPTFGPCFIYLYGSARSSDSVFQRESAHAPLNDGLAEGVMYRGRLLVSVRTQVLPDMAVMQLPPSVHVEAAPPVADDSSQAVSADFFLSAVVMEAHMIDKRFQDKPVQFELSIGNAGNTLDGECGSSAAGSKESIEPEWCSTTPAMKPVLGPEPSEHLNLPFGHVKPVIWVRSNWPDHRRRLYLSNMLYSSILCPLFADSHQRILERLDFGMSDVLEMVRLERGDADRRLRGVLEQLSADCVAYLQHYKQENPVRSSTKQRSKLDRQRERHCQREIDHMGTMARAMRPLLNRHSFKEKLHTTQQFSRKLRDICEDAQHSLPDVFLWMLAAGRRVAYHRIPARQIIYSPIDEQRGPLCHRRQTILLKPGGGNKKQTLSSVWSIEADLEVYIWLGLWHEREHSLDGVPEGFSKRAVPAERLHYTEKGKFTLRAHMYQARSLIASDSSGLSDPFAQVHFCGHSACTQVIEQTLSPTWDEMIQLQKIELCGDIRRLIDDPPLVVVNVFDQDNVGKCEFLGRAQVKPHVKLGTSVNTSEREESTYKTPQLEWHDLYRSLNENAGQLLAVFELIECNLITGDLTGRVESVEPVWRQERGPVLPIPRSIRPTLSKYKIELLFWGLRDLRRVNFLKVDRPRVDIECGGYTVQSSVITNYSKNPNFSMPIKSIDIDLPDQEVYCPPVTIRVVDCRSFGRFTLVGTHVISTIHRFMQCPGQETVSGTRDGGGASSNDGQSRPVATETLIDVENGGRDDTAYGVLASLPSNVTVIHLSAPRDAKNPDKNLPKSKRKQTKQRKDRGCGSTNRGEDLSEDSKDWWSRYFASIQSQQQKANTNKPNSDERFHSERLRSLCDQYSTVKVHASELESVADYNGFVEWLESFQLLRGRRTGDESDDERRLVGIFKGSLKVHKYPLPPEWEPLSRSVPSNEPIKVLVRVYVVRATDLHPADLNGKADPYLVIRLGHNKMSDKDNYVSKQLNPVFGKCFQFEAIFPHDSMLHIQVFDWDLLGRDDLIGETKIDLENRFYSKHRATCGLPLKYDTEVGPNQWRDSLKPSQILAKLCKEQKVDGPQVLPPGNRVRVGRRTFIFRSSNDEADDETVELPSVSHSKSSKKQRAENYEHMSLAILHRWSEVAKGCGALITEHVETRPLFHPDRALGIEQGKLDMWVDMFPMDSGQPPPGPPVDISPRKPKSFELRVIIWNTDEVVLEDDAFFTGEKMSDIYVKGWLKGPEDTQSTDIHYRSLTGEGNFNWRFVFPFEYLPAEEKIVISRKESLFSWDETESKIPARLQLQVWDADHFSADDFLGALTLDLNRFPRGAKTAAQCKLDILRPDSPYVSIFKQRRIKGWWPFFIKRADDQQMELTGKVEAELHLLTGEEAEKNPAGLGRSEPDPLEKPNRPDASFVWFLNPLKSVKYIVWHRYKWFILKVKKFTKTINTEGSIGCKQPNE
ncbi:otoferlin-like isoform X4 [Varroa destructor]|uniref:C2 domain-containing protein n=1 Tax=Varroa destructor TaxID=109461 RepID=A0A7M7J908_VARDE|nr:otoferlin-like isoform X4 [Varroa destructor]